jgi:hypothetical protein
MNFKSYQLCDDWGWFIDIENNNCSENIIQQPCRSPIKKFNSRLTYLPSIEEDDYDYYQKNYKDPEENYDVSVKPPKKNETNTIFNVGSTTLITAVITYVIFIVL